MIFLVVNLRLIRFNRYKGNYSEKNSPAVAGEGDKYVFMKALLSSANLWMKKSDLNSLHAKLVITFVVTI